MSDSFADLWASSTPKAPQTLGKLSSKPTSPPVGGSSNKYDAFSMLSNASSPSLSANNSRSATPNVAPQRQTPQPAKSTSGDAFAGLGFSSASGGGKNLTMAERAKKAEQDRLNAQLKLGQANQAKLQADHGQWAGLDALAVPASKTTSSASLEEDWGFNNAPPPKKEKAADDDWGLGDFGTTSQPPAVVKTPPTTTTSQSKMALWDFDDFASAPQAAPVTLNNSRPNDNPDDDFDFGNREDGPVDDGDDVLGMLGKPVTVSARTSPSPAPSPQPPKPTSRSASPPPHIIGAIVEMGFTPQQARIALAATDTGLNVEAALDILLSQTQPQESSRPTREEELEDDGWGHLPPPRRTQPRPGRDQPERRDTARSPGAEQVQNQTDKIISQASELGMNVFNKANAFWNMGKEKVQKAYSEYNAGESSRVKSDGRPRWMQQPEEHEAGPTKPAPRKDDGWGDAPSGSGFRDDDEPIPPKNPPRAAKPQPKPEPEVDLFSPSPATPSTSSDGGVYKSRFRNRNARDALASSPAPTALPSKPKRPEVHATPAELASSASHNTRGTQSLAAGAYADAETAFTLAIDSLPAKHQALVPLYNYRALARLKNGDTNGAIADAGNVIEILGDVSSYGTTADRAHIVTAWKRRAEAFEAREKWEDARQDWERVAGSAWANDKEKGEGVRGAGRCRSATAPKPPKPKPAARPPVRRGATPPSKAVAELRKANEAADAEAELKHSLKDSVDARLVAWKGGKENNIRALLASLDSVLWEELKWETVGMKDLITEKQVKIKYMKAIGRVHPDKLNASNTTLEHRMIANGVFGALNEAWNAFQSSS